MEFDIPLPEELELLEANSHFYEEEEDDDYLNFEEPPYPYPIEGDEEKEEEPVAQKEPHVRQPDSIDINGCKRPRSLISDPIVNLDEVSPASDKRSKVDNNRVEIEDEDWLRFSPVKEAVHVMEEEEEEEVIPKEVILSRYASEIDGECFPITAPDGGERVYAKFCRALGDEEVKKLDVKAKSNGLIKDPISVLLQLSEKEAFNKALQTSSEDQNETTSAETSVMHEKLWVEKYSPCSFTELLSDEQTNREVLLWLKQWDASVFGSEIRSTTEEVLSALKRHSTPSHHKKSDSSFTRKKQFNRWSKESYGHSKNADVSNSNTTDDIDLWNKKSKLTGPPEQKILLLCGAPGLGKTTLAHIAAKHCGYRVVEINASDERSASAIETRILDVVQMNSVTADSRPKCLVIDEIDGALGDGKGAVDVILKMVLAERKHATGKENIENGKTSSKKERRTAPLSRPIICICNDLYAPALRPLRQIAKVHIFVQPTVSRVVNRLKYICNMEGMKARSFALTALADFTECDIRSCLNTLQFLNKRKETLNVIDIGSQVVGRKDMSKSLFDIWKEIFTTRKMKRERSTDASGSEAKNFDFLHTLISSRGDYDLIFDGIHENILQLHYHDPVMDKTISCLDSLGTSDLLHRYILRTQHMPLYVYFPSLVIPIHRRVAQIQKPIIEWPKSFHRCRTLLVEKQESLRSWHHKIPPYIGRHLSIKSFVEDSVSPLLHILSPPTLRPVASHLLSDRQKDQLAGLVMLMCSYSLTYKNVKSDPVLSNLREAAASDASLLALDPHLFDFISFKGHQFKHHVLALAMKQVLVHEVEKQKILQASGGSFGILNKPEIKKINQDLARKTNAASNESQRNPVTSKPPLVSVGIATTSKPNSSDVKKASRTALNFFDRFRKSRKDYEDPEDVQKRATAKRDSRPLLFKFNEGFTNAVKRPVRMREFLL
ncbi:chromosome transmission fidelity protein 18 homolog [Capsella rubella]|uniref:chromosome transmission fidelity protein 18 homolog n=1 Tax=Capsella rubella TaxID=81985 RepID=UPI000CD4EFD2|nr:chromosome transmission fidelity protein 18 homolog [Capsella rubella]XP_023632923.1 chromosome transmission fidelity protein 18 homolog [Capsella rubella]